MRVIQTTPEDYSNYNFILLTPPVFLLDTRSFPRQDSRFKLYTLFIADWLENYNQPRSLENPFDYRDELFAREDLAAAMLRLQGSYVGLLPPGFCPAEVHLFKIEEGKQIEGQEPYRVIKGTYGSLIYSST